MHGETVKFTVSVFAFERHTDWNSLYGHAVYITRPTFI